MNTLLFKIFFLIIMLLPVIPLVFPGLPITHDGQDHVARIANFYKNLEEGNIIPRWAANLNWGYGHPILEFLYPLPSYIASFFHFVGFSLVDSTKIVFALGMMLSPIFMYLWLSRFTTKISALLGGVIYTYAPYRFVELYVRGDIGENLAFVFIPLVLFFVHNVYRHGRLKDVAGGAISLALLVLSHNAISLMIMPFLVGYGGLLFHFSKSRNSLAIKLMLILVLGLGLSAFFWIPGLLEGKYTLRNIVTKGEYLKRFVDFKDFIYSPWNYGGSGDFSIQFGILSWIAIITFPYTYLKSKSTQTKSLLIFLFLYLLIGIFLMIPISNFLWFRIILLQNFQFPWRFLAIVVFSSSVLGALFLNAIPKKISIILGTFLILICVLSSLGYMIPKGYLSKPESFYNGIYDSTTDTGESAPIWSIRFMEKRPPSSLEVVDGDASIKNLNRTSTRHQYQVTVNKKTIFRENTVYFLGWQMQGNGDPIAVDFHTEHYNGVMKFTLDKGEYLVEAIYQETRLRLFSNILSAISIVALGGLLLIPFAKIRYGNKQKK